MNGAEYILPKLIDERISVDLVPIFIFQIPKNHAVEAESLGMI